MTEKIAAPRTFRNENTLLSATAAAQITQAERRDLENAAAERGCSVSSIVREYIQAGLGLHSAVMDRQMGEGQ